jgi:hypothetical protein
VPGLWSLIKRSVKSKVRDLSILPLLALSSILTCSQLARAAHALVAAPSKNSRVAGGCARAHDCAVSRAGRVPRTRVVEPCSCHSWLPVLQ